MPADAATLEARTRLYLSRAQSGTVRDNPLAFYSGKATVPNSFTGNLALGVSSDGPGANLLDGVSPPIVDPVPCDEPLISEVQVTLLDDNVRVRVTYTNPDPETDVYVLFVPGSGVNVAPLSVSPGPGPDQVTLFFPDAEVLPGGLYTLKVMRASDPTRCFSTRANVLTIESFVCTLEITDMTGDGVSPNPALFPGSTDNVVSLTGTGFLSGTVSAQILQVFGGPPGTPLNIDSVNVIDDNNLTIQFDTFLDSDGGYGVVLTIDEEPTCTAMIGFEIFEPTINVSAA